MVVTSDTFPSKQCNIPAAAPDPNTCFANLGFCFVCFCYSSDRKMVIHCGWNLYSLLCNNIEHPFHPLIGYLYIFYKVFVQAFCSF